MKEFNQIYRGKNVFITGHTGFKGSWLSMWLTQLGANVTGYALKPPTDPSHFELLNLPMKSIIGDISNRDNLKSAIEHSQPEIVFHLAAQPLVRDSYLDPIGTYETNVIGTLNVLKSASECKSVKAIVNITTDKCYENNEWIWGYRENDDLGGHDPYSSSKACSEIATNSFRRSFFPNDQFQKKHNLLIATARAGNVIGGGDWARDRLIPDIVKAASKNESVKIRNPKSTRPWQHVLEPLNGYLMLGQKLLEERSEFAEAWNFGPNLEDNLSVSEVFSIAQKHWDAIKIEIEQNVENLHEANLLLLDCTKAQKKLGWKPKLNSNQAIEMTIEWYKTFYIQNKIRTEEDLNILKNFKN